jgi:GNAT superfamily N-acetyltransferase
VPSVVITLPREEELPAISMLAWPDIATAKRRHLALRAWFDAGQLVIARLDGAVIGVTAVDESFFDQAFVSLIAVAENHRRLGLGKALLSAVTDRAMGRRVFTASPDSNFPMRMLLASLHWENVGTVRGLDDSGSQLFYRAPFSENAG